MNAINSDQEKSLIKAQLQAILNSKQLENAPTVRAFLEFVVNETLSGRGQSLKAYAIAVEVFGRNSQFDPSSDTIVRTTAGRVRKALEAYYRTCEATPQVVISLPKGRYVPSFDIRNCANLPSDPVLPAQSRIHAMNFRPRWLIVACALVAAAITMISLVRWEVSPESFPDSIVIDVRPVEDLSEQAQSLAQEIDARLAPALARIQLAEIIPPTSGSHEVPNVSTTNRNANDGFFFTLKSNIVGTTADRELLWKLIDTTSNHILWASREQISTTDSASIAATVDKIAFQVLGNGGAVSTAISKYPSNILSRPGCITRGQIMEMIENDTTFPELRGCLERIVADTPRDASAWAILSSFYTLRSHFYAAGSSEERARLVELAEQAAQKAVVLAPQSYLTKVALMHLSLRQGRIEEFEALEREIQKRYPGDIYLQIRIATRIARLGRGREALQIFDKAQNDFGIDLKNWAPGIAVAYIAEGEYEQAHRQMLRTTSNLRFVYVLHAAILGKLNRADEAAPIVHRLLETYPDIRDTFYSWLIDVGWSKTVVLDIADGLARAGLIVDTTSSDLSFPAPHHASQ